MTDLERELRELLDEDARQAPPPREPSVPVRRARRRQVGTMLAAGMTAAALATAALVGLRVLLPPRNTGRPIAPDVGPTRTATVPYLTVTYPSDWVLTVRSDPSSLSATIQLTSFDPDVRANPVCFSDNQTMPSDGVLLNLEVGSGVTGEGVPTWPQELEPNFFGNPELCGVQGEQLAASWASDDGSLPYDARTLIGPEASPEDRDRLLAAFRSLVPRAPGTGLDNGSGVVLSSGSVGQNPWTLFVYPDTSQAGIVPDMELGGEGGGLRGTSIGGVVAERPDDTWVSAPVMGGNTMLFGAVSEQVVRVEIRPDGTEPFEAELVDPPESLGANVRVFVAPMTGAPRGTVATYNVAGNLVAERTFTPDGYSSPKTERHEPPDGAIAGGRASGEEWRLVDAGEEIRLVDVDGNEIAFAPRDPEPYLSLAVYLSAGRDASGAVLVFGVAGPDVTEVVLFTSGLPGSTQLAPIGDGLQAWWQLYSPGDLEGQVIALGRDCEVLQAIDLATGETPETVAPTSCG